MKKVNEKESYIENRCLRYKPDILCDRDIQLGHACQRVRSKQNDQKSLHGQKTQNAPSCQRNQRLRLVWQHQALALMLAVFLFIMPGCGLLQRYLPDDINLPDPASLLSQTDSDQDSDHDSDQSDGSRQSTDGHGATQADTTDESRETVADSVQTTVDEPTTASDQPAGSVSQPEAQSVTVTETEKSPATTETSRETSTNALQPLSTQFYTDAENMIQNQLAAKTKEIKLDALFEQYRVTEPDIDQVIENLFDIYQAVFLANPWYFYLNGSVQVNYTMLSGAQTRVSGMTMLPQYWQFANSLSDAQLDALIKQVDQVIIHMTDDIRRQTSEPWQQLAALHQTLIRHITYDTTENQEHNHAASALLDGLTLCQGYAQAFQMGGQRLGLDVITITGEAGGQGHAWNMVRLDGQYYHVDVTHDDPVPDAGPDQPVRHLHFLRSDAIMRETHQWRADQVPTAGRDGAHYYRQTGRIAENRDTLASLLSSQLNAHDLASEPVFFLEILYTGSDIPDRAAVDEMLQQAMRQQSITGQFYYRIQITKSVVLVEVSVR